MKVGERGQVTIPKQIRDRFAIGPHTEVEFRIVRNSIVLQKKPNSLCLNQQFSEPAHSRRMGKTEDGVGPC